MAMIVADPASLAIRETDPAHLDARRCLRRYFAELDRRADADVDPRIGYCIEESQLAPPLGSFIVAYQRDAAVGCGAIRHRQGAPSEIRRIWVERSSRGLGVGQLLLAELEVRALASGAPAVRIELHRSLHEAIAMVRGADYREVPAFSEGIFPDYWFEKHL